MVSADGAETSRRIWDIGGRADVTADLRCRRTRNWSEDHAELDVTADL